MSAATEELTRMYAKYQAARVKVAARFERMTLAEMCAAVKAVGATSRNEAIDIVAKREMEK